MLACFKQWPVDPNPFLLTNHCQLSNFPLETSLPKKGSIENTKNSYVLYVFKRKSEDCLFKFWNLSCISHRHETVLRYDGSSAKVLESKF